MRVRLRPKWSDEKLAEIYSKTYDHTQWDEHVTRISWTASRLQQFIDLQRPPIERVVDLACGDGALLNALENVREKVFCDIVAAPHLTLMPMSMETSVKYMTGDLLVCSEVLEHLDDPDRVLRDAHGGFQWIAITTPLGEDDPEKNEEHYWGWDMLGVDEMLTATGWSSRHIETLNTPYYTYQFWIAKRGVV